MDQQPAPTASTTKTLRTDVALISGETNPQVLDGALVYDPTDPYAVRLHVAQEGAPSVVWTFARDLLADGLYEPTGDGDVLVWPCLGTQGEAVVIIELRSPSGMAMLQAPSRVVQTFVTGSHALVPAGLESQRMDLDALVAHLRD